MCDCGLLDNWANNNQMPIVKNSKGEYLLLLSDEVVISLNYCISCGYDIKRKKEADNKNYLEEKLCSCKLLSTIKKPPNSIEYVENLGYYVIHIKFGSQQIRYCPNCGSWLLKN